MKNLVFGLILISQVAAAMPGVVGRGVIGAKGSCLEHHSNWTPYYSPNLIGYWKLNGVGAIADAATIPSVVGAAGIVGNANGTGLSYITGNLDQGIKFDGVDDYVDLGLATTNYTIYTVSFWIKPGTSTTSGTIFMHGDSNACHYNPSVALKSSSGGLTFTESGCGAAGALGSQTISTTAWSHVAITRNGQTVYVYINGVLKITDTSQPTPGTTSASRFVIGSNFQGTSSPHYLTNSDAALDDVAFWNIDLSAAQILGLYNNQLCN